MPTTEANIERLSFEKIFHHPRCLRGLVKGEDVYPVHMQLGPVNYCNHDCTFCYAARSKSDARGVARERIDVGRLMEIIEEMHELGLRAVTLVGSGEPMLHPRIHDIITGIAQRGVDVGMFTNGSCMTDRAVAAIAEHMTFVRFSTTGATSEVHNLVHGNGDFDQVIGNMKKLVAARRGIFPTLGSQFILASYSAGDVVEGTRLAQSLGLDYYEIKPAYTAPEKDHQLANTLSAAAAVELMLEAKQYEDENFKVYAKVDQMHEVFRRVDNREYDDCPGSRTNAVLEADLLLYLCGNQKTPQTCFGDLRERSFKEVWHGEQRREVLNRLDVHACEPRCRMDPLNRIVHELRTGKRREPVDLPPADPANHPNFL